MTCGSRAVVRARFLFKTLLVLLALRSETLAGPYVTPTTGIRWNDVGGIRWNDVGGIRWNDVGGIRWNDVGGIEWSEASGFFSNASGIRWNDVGGIRWNDVGSLTFDGVNDVGTSIDLDLLNTLSFLPDTSSVEVVLTYVDGPTLDDLHRLEGIGILGGEIFHALPFVVVNATKGQMRAIADFPNVRSIYANKTLSILDADSAALVGATEVASDPMLRSPAGGAVTGAGVAIAVLDTGVDATHPDLPSGSKVVENVRLTGLLSAGPGFVYAPAVVGSSNTDPVLGHGSAVASVAAGTGAASGGLHPGIAPGASILGLSAGDVVIVNMLEGFDYVLENASRLGVRVVNCSWGSEGPFDPDDPVNVATRLLYDAGISVVFAAGNDGPAPDTLNAYAVAPWVIGVGSTRKDGKLSDFSSRGIFEELLYHPKLVAPGESIVTARTGTLGGDPSDPPGSLTTRSSGTSFAAPHVAGVIALMLEAAPALTPAEVARILQSTATPILVRDRSEVGAGRVDAWAAVAQALDPSRPFGTHVPGWLDERPYRIEHRQAEKASHVLPAGGTLLIPAEVDGTESAWQMGIAWGSFPGLADLDVRLLDVRGAEIARSDSRSGIGLFGRTDGVDLLGDVPRGMKIEVSFKPGTDAFAQEFWVSQEGSAALLDAYTDIATLSPSDRAVVTRAVSRNLIVGRDDTFAPNDPLLRGELARSLALTAGSPQRIPPFASFRDVPMGDPFFPYVETVAGARSRDPLLGPPVALALPSARLEFRQARLTPIGFQASLPVRRIDFAIAMVRAAGKQEEAALRAGRRLPFADARQIPSHLSGYVAVAVECGLIDVAPTGGRTYFAPDGVVSRLEASRRLLRLLSLLGK